MSNPFDVFTDAQLQHLYWSLPTTDDLISDLVDVICDQLVARSVRLSDALGAEK